MKQRIISAVVLLAIFIPILLIGKTPYAILMAVLAWMGLYELLKARKKKNRIILLKKNGNFTMSFQ